MTGNLNYSINDHFNGWENRLIAAWFSIIWLKYVYLVQIIKYVCIQIIIKYIMYVLFLHMYNRICISINQDCLRCVTVANLKYHWFKRIYFHTKPRQFQKFTRHRNSIATRDSKCLHSWILELEHAAFLVYSGGRKKTLDFHMNN